ncbi:MAG: hypothetical protein ABEH90_08410 [Halolamina sp.]
MLGTRTAGHLTVGIVTALALGAIATFARLLAGSGSLAASALTFGLVVAVVAAGVLVGSHGRPDETPYW